MPKITLINNDGSINDKDLYIIPKVPITES